MVYSNELGYDPEEWEECPPPDHFLVFAPLTRVVLSLGAIVLAAAFFWLIENHSKGGSKKEEEGEEKVTTRREGPVEATREKTSSSDPLSLLKSVVLGGVKQGGEDDFVQRSFAQRSFATAYVPLQNVEELQQRAEPRFGEAQQTAGELAESARVVARDFQRGDAETTKERSPQQVAEELRAAELEFRDLLGQGGDAPPPAVPPHRPADMDFFDRPMGHDIVAEYDKQRASSQQPLEASFSAPPPPSSAPPLPTKVPSFEEEPKQQSPTFPPRTEEHYQRVQAGLDNLLPEQLHLQISPDSSRPVQMTGQTAEFNEIARERQRDTKAMSPIDEAIDRVQRGLLQESPARPVLADSGEPLPSLHDVYEARQRQLSPPASSPAKIPTPEEAAALRSWEEELARVEADKLARLNDIIVGGDDASEFAGSETAAIEHLAPADRISMMSADSDARRLDEAPLGEEPARQKLDDKMEQISSELEKSLLTEIQQLARQTHEMHAELARARSTLARFAMAAREKEWEERSRRRSGSVDRASQTDDDEDLWNDDWLTEGTSLHPPRDQRHHARVKESEYSTDEVSEGQVDPNLDVFKRSGDVKFIPGAQGGAPVSSARESRDSDEYVKVTPPQVSGKASPSGGAPVRAMSPEEEKELACLVAEYDLLEGNGHSPRRSEDERPLDIEIISTPTSATSPLSPLSPDILSDYEKISSPSSPLVQSPIGTKPGAPVSVDPFGRPIDTTVDAFGRPIYSQALPPQQFFDAFGRPIAEEELRPRQPQALQGIPPEEQARLEEVLRVFDSPMLSSSRRVDFFGRPLPLAPPSALLDPFGRPIAGLAPVSTVDSFGLPVQPPSPTTPVVTLPREEHAPHESAMMGFYGEEGELPTTEMTFPLAPRRSIHDLKEKFPDLPTQASIEVVEPEAAHLPVGVVLPAGLDEVVQSLKSIDAPFLHEHDTHYVDAPMVAIHHSPQEATGGQVVDPFGRPMEPQALSPAQAPPSVTDRPLVEASATASLPPSETPILSAPSPNYENIPMTGPVKQISLENSVALQPSLPFYDRPSEEGLLKKQSPVREQDQAAEGYFTLGRPAAPGGDVGATVALQKKTPGEIPREELRNIAEADLYLQDAIEYMATQKQTEEPQRTQPTSTGPTGFVMEEEMLSSQGEGGKARSRGEVRTVEHPPSADGTSKLVRTNDVFERIDAPDDHDDMTYAPEIQSVEIPPDQMSETSDNLHDEIPMDYPIGQSAEAQKLEQEMRAQEQALEEAAASKAALQHKAALAQAPHIVSMGGAQHPRFPSSPSVSSAVMGESPRLRKQSSLLSILGVTSTQEMLLKIDSLEALSGAMRKAGLESTNLIFGIDYTASNKYQGEESFGGHSLHTIHPNLKNPYQQVISILGRTLAPFTSTGCIPVFGFGDARTSDWSVFPLKEHGECTTLEEVLKTYNEVTPTVELSGPTNFSPLIYQAIEICQRTREYHILVIIADGQVTNEKATRRAIVQACQYPLSIIVVGVGDGPWEMMKVFDESLPKRPWDNFHFVEYHKVVKRAAAGSSDADVKVAIQSLLEIPDQYRCCCNLGLVRPSRSPSSSVHQLQK